MFEALEAEAVALYERLGLDPATPTSAARLAWMLYGVNSVVWGSGLGRRVSQVTWERDEPRIVLRRGLTTEQAQHAIGHEIAHLLLGQRGGCTRELEAACDYLGAALVAPRPAVLVLHREIGLDVATIAEHLVVTQTCAALRIGEVLGVPLATIGPRVRVRGPDEYVWPSEQVLRAWARRPPPGVRRVRLTDRPHRSVLLVDAA